MRLIITGYGGHGKNTVCDMLEALSDDFKYISSSEMACKFIVYPALKEMFGYTSPDECYEHRHSHREKWFNLIKDYNTPDLIRLGKLIFSMYNVYNGIRNLDELNALKNENMVDVVIWVDASLRLPPESSKSMTVQAIHSHYILDNNGTIDELKERILELLTYLKNKGITYECK